MKKTGVFTDSNSGITQAQAKELGIKVIPMPVLIDSEEYFEDITLTQEKFYEMLTSNVSVSTSQPSPETVMKLWDEALEEYEGIVYIPMSSGLSGSYQTAMMLAEDYDGRVQVVNNQRISVTMRQSVLDALALANEGKSAEEICKILEEDKFNSSIYIMLDTLSYLKQGGRLTSAVAALGAMLKIKPVLQIQGEKLDAFSVARTLSSAKNIMLNAVEKDIVKRFGCTADGEGMHLMVAHTQNLENAEIFAKEIQERFPKADIYIDPLSLSVSCHIGPGSLAIACAKVLI
ncbi:MAG: DegV family protein [Lachnospiraceae bacterium]|nr:DegV family protein [Lachnospiraceae bacterium]